MTNPGKRPKFFQRQFIVDPKTQTVILTYSLFMSTITVAITGMSFVGFQIISQSYGGNPSFKVYMILGTLLIWVLAVAFLTFLGILISHRIAGPIYRLRLTMRNLAKGSDLEYVRFRKGDHFHDIADDFNAVLDRLAKAENKSINPPS